mgnify:CR=1 FL=1
MSSLNRCPVEHAEGNRQLNMEENPFSNFYENPSNCGLELIPLNAKIAPGPDSIDRGWNGFHMFSIPVLIFIYFLTCTERV